MFETTSGPWRRAECTLYRTDIVFNNTTSYLFVGSMLSTILQELLRWNRVRVHPPHTHAQGAAREESQHTSFWSKARARAASGAIMLLYIQWLGTAVMAAQPLNGGFLHANGRGELTDELGRVRILHGVNRVRKAPPWYFVEQTTSDDEFALMQELGLTALRLGFMWSGYNPAPGIFNKTYIDTIHSIIERASRHGIYVLLDMHQDCFSSNFCLYDGVPQWVANKSTPRHSFPWPFTGNCSSRDGARTA